MPTPGGHAFTDVDNADEFALAARNMAKVVVVPEGSPDYEEARNSS